MSEDPNIKKRILNAIIRKIEGVKDLKRRLDYLMNPDALETSSRLTDMQIQGVNECCWLGDNFSSMEPLKDFARGFAKWAVSKEGKGRQEAISMIMASEKRELAGLGIHLHGPEAEAKAKGKGKK